MDKKDEKATEKQHHYNPVKAIRYHFTEFNIWVGIFVAINGGLLVAYSGDGLNCDSTAKILIAILGYIVSILFFCCSRIYHYCIKSLSFLLDEHFEKNLKEYILYPPVLKRAKIYTTYIVLIFSIILMIIWGVLIISNIKNCKQVNEILTYIIISVISLIVIINGILFVIALVNKNKKTK